MEGTGGVVSRWYSAIFETGRATPHLNFSALNALRIVTFDPIGMESRGRKA
jgi:hypothetical protein